MRLLRTLAVLSVALCVTSSALLSAAGDASAPAAPARGFRHRGFYLHGCWKYNYPFAVRSWERKPFQWSYADANHQAILKQWCRKHVKDIAATTKLAAGRLVERKTLPEAVANLRVAELLRQR